MSVSLARRLLAALVLVLYVSLSSMRQWTQWLRAEGLLGAAVVFALGCAAIAVGSLLLRRRGEQPIPLLALLLAGALVPVLLTAWELPEERIHLAAYATVGALSWPAGARRLGPALLLAMSIGAVDELLQLSIASRVFDLRDLLANVVIAAAAVVLLSGGRRAWLTAPMLAALWLILLALPVAGPSVDLSQQFAAPGSVHSVQPDPVADPATESEAEAAYAGASVVLITIDALRADHLRPWGEPPLSLPTFAGLQQRSVSFEEVFANAAWTSPGMVSFLTGLHPSVHGVEGRGMEFPAGATTFLDTLHAAGYSTWGFAGDGEENYGGLGFRHLMDRTLPPEEMLAAALAAQDVPVFAWLHLRDIHAPYDASAADLEALGLPSQLPTSPILERARTHHTVPRREFPGRHTWLKGPIRALYAAELATQDRVLASVLDRLSSMDDLIVVVSADHGEELLDHDGIGHASTTLHSPPHPELVRIPLFIQLPDGRGAGEQRSGAFQQMDLVPTLGGLLGVPTEQPVPGLDLDGVDLSDAVLGVLGAEAPSTEARPVFVSTSPCGWQCPPARLQERIYALIEGRNWLFCDPMDAPCEASIAGRLQGSARRSALLRGVTERSSGGP